MSYISVAIDGPAGAGKSTVSKAAAKRLGFVYIDTGAMYRAAALYAIRKGIIGDSAKIIPEMDNIDIKIGYFDDAQHVFLNGEDVSDKIRTNEVSAGASAVAVIPEVRKKLVALQQKMAETENVVMDGRDICSYVLPNAQVKIFLTASAKERAKRRWLELKEKGVECDIEQLQREIEARDENDSSRAAAPLRQAPDAVLIDTSDMSFEESVAAVLKLAEEVR